MAAIEKSTVIKNLNEIGIMPLFYHSDADLVIEVVKTCYDAGVRNFEFVDRGNNTLEVLQQLLQYARQHLPALAIGVGTIYSKENALKYIEAGADFIVTPVLIPEIGALCIEKNVPWFPGVATLTEIFQARQIGAEVLKLYPAVSIGADFIKTVKQPMPDVKIMASGGPKGSKESINEWFGAGAYAVSISSYFFPDEVIANRDLDFIKTKVSNAVTYVQQHRKGE